jgi:hypothetical protein
MSHLSILPTVLRELDLLEAALLDLGLSPLRGGGLQGFADDRQQVDLSVTLAGGQRIGWRRQRDGRLALVADLQRLGRSRSLRPLIGSITRRYAARLALQEASRSLAGAVVEVSA